MGKAAAAFKKLGVTDDQIGTSWKNVYPRYDYKSTPCIEIYAQLQECNPRSEIGGYRASNSLSVTINSNRDVGKVINATFAAVANNVNGAYFFVSKERQQEIRDGLIQKATENAKSRAYKVAAAADMSRTGVKSINLNDVYFPLCYKDIAQQASGSLTQRLPGQQQVSMKFQVTFQGLEWT